MTSGDRVYQMQMQCDNCLEWFAVYFDDPTEPFDATCPNCNAHFEGLHV